MRLIAFTAAVLLAGTAAAEDQEAVQSPIVLACVDKEGKLLSAEIWRSSGIVDIDKAALQIAGAAKFSPAKDHRGRKPAKSCLKFKVKFVLRDGEAVPAES